MVHSAGMNPNPLSDSDQWALIRAQVEQGMIEHQIVAQALRAQSIISAAFCLVLSLLAFWMWRRCKACEQALIEQEKRHSTEWCDQERRHATELDEQRKAASMELVSTVRATLREFAESLGMRRVG